MSERETTKLFNGITGIDEDIIEAAQTSKPRIKAKSHVWIKWAAVAACLCLAVSMIAIPRVLDLIQEDKNIAGGNATTDVVATKMTFEAEVTEVQDDALIVEPLMGTPERDLSDSIVIGTEDLAELATSEYVSRAQVGDKIKVCYLKENSNISIGEIAVYMIIPLEEACD